MRGAHPGCFAAHDAPAWPESRPASSLGLMCRTSRSRWQPEIPLISHCGHSSKLAGVAVGNAGFGKDAAMR